MSECVFCKIIAGEIPSRRIYEDGAAVAFLDVAPLHEGHTLVVPKRHVADLVADPTALAEIAPAVSAVAASLVAALDADGLNMFQSTGAIAGQEVFHLHVHLVPRHEGDGGLFEIVARPEAGDLDEVARRITDA